MTTDQILASLDRAARARLEQLEASVAHCRAIGADVPYWVPEQIDCYRRRLGIPVEPRDAGDEPQLSDRSNAP